MSLISFEFFIFLSLTCLSFYLCPIRYRYLVLLSTSLYFYLSYGILALICILFVTLSSYLFARLIRRDHKEESEFVKIEGKRGRAVFLYFAVVTVLCFWMSAKLFNIYGGYLLPIGISFYSLRVISYLIEVKNGKTEIEKNFLRYTLFTVYFPISLLGPITDYREIRDSLINPEGADREMFISGVIRILWGVFKKTVIANTLSASMSIIAAESEVYRGAYTLFLLIFYSAQIYADFSGGIDMVIGASCLFGIALPENFDRPFSSTNLREYWNRWHMTLGEWFERNVFYPFSLSRPMQIISRLSRKKLGQGVGRKIPVYTATLLTWLLTGLWHGTKGHFVAWGLINGLFVIASQESERIFLPIYERLPHLKSKKKALTALKRARVFFIIGAVRLLDVYESLPLTLKMLGSVFFDAESYKSIMSGGLVRLISLPELITVIIALMIVFLASEKGIRCKEIAKRPVLASACIFFLVLISLLMGTYGLEFEAGDFIYSRF